MKTRVPQLGSVVWAEMADANGFRKVRPAVVVTATADIVAGRPVRVLAITTRLPNPLPDDHVLLPWDPQGKARSGLRRQCVAVTTWQAEIAPADVQQVVGHLPATVMQVLLTKAAAVLSSSPTDTSETTPEADSSTKPATAPPR